MRSHLATAAVALAGAAMLATSPVCAAPRDDIKATFARFVAAQNTHDRKAVGDLLADSPDFLWLEPGNVVRTRAAAIEHFGKLFEGTWRVDPDWSTFQIVMLDVSTAEVFVRVAIASRAPARSMRMNQVLVYTARGWRVLTILADDAPQS